MPGPECKVRVCTSHRNSEWQNLSVQLCFPPAEGWGEDPGARAGNWASLLEKGQVGTAFSPCTSLLCAWICYSVVCHHLQQVVLSIGVVGGRVRAALRGKTSQLLMPIISALRRLNEVGVSQVQGQRELHSKTLFREKKNKKKPGSSRTQ
jgi:hypothetical protein